MAVNSQIVMLQTRWVTSRWTAASLVSEAARPRVSQTARHSRLGAPAMVPSVASRAFPALPAFFMAEVPVQRHLRAPQQRALHSPFSVVAVCAPDIRFPESSFRSLVPALRADG